MTIDSAAFTDRRRARTAGVLFILATVSAIVGGVMILPIEDGSADAADQAGLVRSGVLLELILAASVIAIAVTLYPLLRRRFEVSALAYVAARTLEAAFILIATLSALIVVTVGQDASASAGEPVAVDALMAIRDWSYFLGTVMIFAVTALILNYMLFVARLVPAWLSVWGLVGAIAIGLGGIFALYGAEASEGVDIDIAWSAAIGLQEMVLAFWLILRGFKAGEDA